MARSMVCVLLFLGCGDHGAPSRITLDGSMNTDGSVADGFIGDGSVADGFIGDGSVADGFIGDAACLPQCSNDVLIECTPTGTMFTLCDATCVSSPEPHCGIIVPTGVVTVEDLEPDPTLTQLLLDQAATVVNTETGEITGARGPGSGVLNGIEFTVRDGVGVFRASNIIVTSDVDFIGANPVAFVSLHDIQVAAFINATGDCLNGNPGPGGARGAPAGMSATGLGLGGAGVASQGGYSGGGGGGHGAVGGVGGTSYPTGSQGPMIPGGTAGTAFGDDNITVLRGGGGGGGGAGPDAGQGGGGGGAIQLVATNEIRFDGSSQSYAGIDANGCGGKRGDAGSGGGGGGGAGGAILMEAPTIDLGGTYTGFRAMGGGGGAYDDLGLAICDGNGATAGTPGGGNGGGNYNGPALEGAQGGGSQSGGGAGGSVGRLRFNYVKEFRVPNGGNTVPHLDAVMTTATKGIAAVE